MTVSYDEDGVPQPVYSGIVGLDSTVHLTGLCGGSPASVYSNIVASIGSCSANGTDITITNPEPLPASFTDITKLHCNGDEVDVTNTSPANPNATSYWNFGDLSPIDSSAAIPLPHIYNDAATWTGTYNITLTYTTYHTTYCTSTATATVSFNHAMTDSFTSDYNAACVQTPFQFNNYSTSANSLTYLWDFGDGFTDTATNPTHAYSLGGIFTVKLVTTDTVGCHETSTISLESIQIDVRTLVHDTSVCLRDSMLLRSLIQLTPDSVNFISVWTPDTAIGEDSAADNTQPATNFLGVGTFIYTVTATTIPPLAANPGGCQAMDTERVVSYPPVTLENITPTQVVAFGSSIQLNASGAVYYTWKPDDGTLNNNNINDPVATPRDSTTIYTVYGMNLYGCLDSAQVKVLIDFDMSEGIPTGFTPNGDGLNDVFRLTTLKYQKLVTFAVFNRWGQKVFETNDPNVGWDGTFNGTPQDIGVYDYIIIIARPDGTNRTYKGNVTLIR